MANTNIPAHREAGNLEYFRRSKVITGVLSIACLFIFIVAIYFTVPAFYTYFWLIIPLFLTILFTKSFGSWEAYTKMREQTDIMQLELDELNKNVKTLEEVPNTSNNTSPTALDQNKEDQSWK